VDRLDLQTVCSRLVRNSRWSDKRARTTYRLAGTDVRVYVGRRVQVFGGLIPSANIAAQAGAIDSTKVAMAVIDRSLPRPETFNWTSCVSIAFAR
jgi:hypothetical protein